MNNPEVRVYSVLQQEEKSLLNPTGSDLYQYKYASTNKGAVVHSFSGETITGVEVFKNSGHAKDGKLLIVSTESGGEGKVYLIDFNELTADQQNRNSFPLPW